jgi:hypothetical protein
MQNDQKMQTRAEAEAEVKKEQETGTENKRANREMQSMQKFAK